MTALLQIRGAEISGKVLSLAARSITEDITILCVEETPEFCHRRLLADECKKYEPNLQVVHR